MRPGNAFRQFKHNRRVKRARADLEKPASAALSHGLNTQLIVSLTSYPLRFTNLPFTIRGLLRQNRKADRTILWIAQEDWAALTPQILALQDEGLEILPCVDMRSYKKLLPTLAMAPDATIVTADDDVHYDHDWLHRLLEAHRKSSSAVVALRAHGICLDPKGTPQPYADWHSNIPHEAQAGDVFPTGVSGVLYAPGCFDARVTDWDTAKTLCPTSDDVWFYWMHRLAGTVAYHPAGKNRILEWEQNAPEGLRQTNIQGGNDAAIAAMTAQFGFPPL